MALPSLMESGGLAQAEAGLEQCGSLDHLDAAQSVFAAGRNLCVGLVDNGGRVDSRGGSEEKDACVGRGLEQCSQYVGNDQRLAAREKNVKDTWRWTRWELLRREEAVPRQLRLLDVVGSSRQPDQPRHPRLRLPGIKGKHWRGTLIGG